MCDLVERRIPGIFVYESEDVFAIMTLEQPNPYKVIVCPRAHVESVYDLTEAQASSIFATTVKIARAVRDASNCEGINLVQSNDVLLGKMSTIFTCTSSRDIRAMAYGLSGTTRRHQGIFLSDLRVTSE